MVASLEKLSSDLSQRSNSTLLLTGLGQSLTSEDNMTILQRCMESGSIKGFSHDEDNGQIVVNFNDYESAFDSYKKFSQNPAILKDGTKLSVVFSQTDFENATNGKAENNNDNHNEVTANGYPTVTLSDEQSHSAEKMHAGKDDSIGANGSSAKRPKNDPLEEELDYGAEDQPAPEEAENDESALESKKSEEKFQTSGDEKRLSSPSAKKKIGGNSDESKVIHLRNLPETYNKNDFCKLIFSFGKITHCIFMKSQAFVEMERLDDATNMIDYCHKYPLYYMDKKIIMQFSQHQKLRKNESHSNNNKIIETTLTYLWNDISPHERAYLGLSVIMATVENMVYPVDIDALHQIFSKYGKVLKIRMVISASGPFKALIQMENPYVARIAVQNTDNQNIYSDANLLRTKLYRIKDLIVQPGDKNSVDFTKSGYQSKASLPHAPPSDRSFNQSSNSQKNQSSILHLNSRDSYRGDEDRSLVVLVSNVSNFGDDLDKKMHSLFVLFSTVGIVNKVKVLYKNQDRAFVEFATPEQANNAISLLNGVIMDTKKLSISAARVKSLVFKPTDNEKFHNDYTRSRDHRFTGNNSRHLSNIYPPSPRLHLANIHASTKDDDIVPLFEKYGKVEFFSFMEKKHMAYLKFYDVNDAVTALINLHGTVINGLTLKVSFAKQ